MPILEIPDKICPHCNGIRWYTRTTKKGVLIQICSIKKNEYNKKYRDKYPEKFKEKYKKLYHEKRKYNKEERKKSIERAKKWNSENLEKHKEHHKKTRQKESYKKYCRDKDAMLRKVLHNHYLVRLIRGGDPVLSRKDIPQEIIDIKRKQIILKRQIA